MDAENVLRQIATTIHQALTQSPVNVPENDSGDEFVTPRPRTRFPLPTLHTAAVEPPLKRLRSSANKLIINSGRRVALRTKSFDVMCLPYQKGNSFPFPRGSTRQTLVQQKLMAKVTIHSQMSEFEVKNELSSVFAQAFCNNTLEFDFHFLSSMPGAKKLMIPNVSNSYRWTGLEVFKIIVKNTVYIMTSQEMQLRQENSEIEENERDTEVDQNIIEKRNLDFSLPTEENIPMTEPNCAIESVMTLRERLQQEIDLAGDTLNVPLLIIDSGEETDTVNEIFNSPVELLQSLQPDLEETCNIYIRRSYVLEDFKRASLRKDFYPYRKLHVQFVGEPGIDVGGLTKEFLDILSRKICNWHVFTGNVGNLTLSASILSLMQELPYSAGVAVGIILCHLKTAVPIFSESLIRHIAGSNKFSIEDIPENDAIKKLLSELNNNEELIGCKEIVALQNELDYFKDLKNINNKKEFISLACRYFCSVKNGAHIAQFIKGLQQTKVADLIKDHPDIMVKLLTGSKFERKTMDANVVYEMLQFSYSDEGSNFYQHEQSASYYLLQFLMDCCCSNGIHSPDNFPLKCCLRDFFQFMTGLTEIPTIMTEVPAVNFYEEPYPMANVCTATLFLPLKIDEPTFRERLYETIMGSPGFGKV